MASEHKNLVIFVNGKKKTEADGFDAPSRQGCFCQTLIGHADQGAHASLISAPPHWPDAKLI